MSGIQGTWSLNFIIGMTLVALTIVLLLAVVAVAVKHWSSEFGAVWAVGALVCIPIVVAITACATFPWEKAYHRYEPKVGEVEAIEKRLVRQDEGMQEKLVVRFAEMPGQWGCEDTRCALVKPGDMLALRCIKRWDYSATDGYDCRFVAHEEKVA